ncbi:MAG: hypothetical protein AB7Q42_04245 [Acidimicrobiia bacterium]
MLIPRALCVAAATLLLGTACSDDDDGNGDGSSVSTTIAGSRATSSPAASELGPADTMTTPRDVTQQVRDLLGTPGPTVGEPDELARTVADALVAGAAECESGAATATVESLTVGEPAFAVIEVEEGCDDSVAGARYDLAMEPDDSSGWVVVTATRQDVCVRGVAGDVCV